MVAFMPGQFSRDMRLRKNTEFRAVFGARNSVSDDMLIVYALPNSLKFARLGACVSRKNGNAVCRNRWKRRIRESFRIQQDVLPQGYDYVVLPRLGATPDSTRIANSLAKLATKAVARCERQQQK